MPTAESFHLSPRPSRTSVFTTHHRRYTSAVCRRATRPVARTPRGAGDGGGVASLRSVAAPSSATSSGLEKVSATGLGELLQPRNGVKERFVFFGGKGGVGKTSTAAAVAIRCADSGLR